MFKLITGLFLLLFSSSAGPNRELEDKISAVIKNYPDIRIDLENSLSPTPTEIPMPDRKLLNPENTDKTAAYNLRSEKTVGSVNQKAVENSQALVSCSGNINCTEKNPDFSPTPTPIKPTATVTPMPTATLTPTPYVISPEPTVFRCSEKLCPMIACLDSTDSTRKNMPIIDDCYCPCVPPPIY